MNTHLDWLTHYGYAGLFAALMLGILAVPVPDETLLAVSGYLIYRGTFRWLPTCATGFLGSVCGITVSYALGRAFGGSLLTRFGRLVRATPERLERARTSFERLGKWLLPVSYFVPGVRHLIGLLAGVSRLRLPVFAGFAGAGALVWSQTFICLGYVFGPHWEKALRSVGQHRWMALAVIGVGLLALWLGRRFQQGN
jgi:membrane protein DedA with SNARE-associated domain